MTFATDVLFLDYDPFSMESRICIYKDGTSEYAAVSSDIEEAANILVNLAYENNIYSIKSHAPFATSSEIRRLVEELESKNYSVNKIEVEGI